jgi:hypothetical protein
MYKAIVNFTDLQDGSKSYMTGDVYPRKGYTPTEKRIKELAGDRNRLGKPVIRYVEENSEGGLVEALPKRKRRRLKDDE